MTIEQNRTRRAVFMERDADIPVTLTPSLQFLYTSVVEIGQLLEVGQSPSGRRRIIPITGGRFSGPRLSGRILPGGADWQIVRFDDVAEVDARYTLETDDGNLIHVSNRGLRHGPREVMERLTAGLHVSPHQYYFRTTPIFETGAPALAWLNKIIAVASGERHADKVIITVYEVR
jgi:hypothetical protein